MTGMELIGSGWPRWRRLCWEEKLRLGGQQGSPFSWNRSYTRRPGKKTERPSSQDHHGVAGGGGAQGIIKMLRELLESEAERKKL